MQESAIQFPHDGIIVLENACVISQNQTVSFLTHDDNATNRTLFDDVKRLTYYDYQQTTVGHVLDDWIRLVQSARYVTDATIWLDECKKRGAENPGHCLNDQAFNLALDLSEREDGYPLKFLYGNRQVIHDGCTGFCCDMMADKMGLVDEMISPPPEGQPICFARLLIPNFAKLRHTQSAAKNASLQLLRHRIFGLHKDLKSTSWLEEPTPNVTIFFYDRSDTTSRRIRNAAQLKQKLEEEYQGVTVDLYGKDEWSPFIDNATAQALLYNSYQYLIAPHGAHLANLIYARPDTKVLEVQCYMPTSSDQAIHQQWYSRWSPAVNLTYAVYTEVEGCKDRGTKISAVGSSGTVVQSNTQRNSAKDWSPLSIQPDLTLLVEMAATHFGLKKRE